MNEECSLLRICYFVFVDVHGTPAVLDHIAREISPIHRAHGAALYGLGAR